MPEMDLKNTDGQTVGTVTLPDEVFAAPVKRHLLHEAVRQYRAGGRAGTHATKNRTEVAGGGKKPWKQKHTGRARHGSSRSPLWRKGGTVHGPQPRDYSYALPRQVRQAALRSALSLKAHSNRLIVVDRIDLGSPKTKDLQAMLRDRLGLDRGVLLVHEGEDRNLTLAARNHPRIKAVRSLAINVYDLLKHEYLVLSRDAAARIGEALSR
jgi:large subunit ribosomal protein L4